MEAFDSLAHETRKILDRSIHLTHLRVLFEVKGWRKMQGAGYEPNPNISFRTRAEE